MAGQNIIKLLLQSSADGSGFTQIAGQMKGLLGNMGDLKKASSALGTAIGGLGKSFGLMFGGLITGGMWSVAAEGVKLLIDKFDLFGRKAAEAAKKAEEGFKKQSEAAREYYATVTKTAAAARQAEDREFAARKAMGDVYMRRIQAELELQRAEALRVGDLDKVATIERQIAEAGRKGAEDRATAEETAARRRMEEAKRSLDAAQAMKRDALKREEDLRKEAAEAAKPREVSDYQLSPTGLGMVRVTRTVIDEAAYKAKSLMADEARKDAEAADDTIAKAREAYKLEAQKWQLARENAKTVAKEMEAARAKEEAERTAADRKAAAAKTAAELKAISERKAAELKAQEESLKKRVADEQKARQEMLRESLRAEQAANQERVRRLAESLSSAQRDVETALGQFMDPKSFDPKAERKAKRREDEARVKIALNAIDLQERRKDWRTATNLSRRDEATRRWLLAKENEVKAKNDLKVVADRLGSIKDLLEAATTV